MILSFMDKVNEWMEPVRDFIYANHNKPAFWLVLFILGLVVFAFTYNALHRD